MVILGCQTLQTLTPYYEAFTDSPQLENLPDNHGPQVNIDAERVAGGSALLKDQAACPFRAFANHRLSARALPEPSYHLNAAQRGTVLHSALEHLWDSLNNSASLLERDSLTLQNDLSDAVRSAFKTLDSSAQRPVW